jgi:hypothetical protein
VSIAGALIAAAAILSSAAADDWTARYAAIAERVKAAMPKLKQELGEYPVYEIFVVRAPQMNPSLSPPERCKPRKKYKPEDEAAMTHYDETATALVALVEGR